MTREFLLARCKAALADRLRKLKPEAAWVEGFDGYVTRVEDNLLAGILPETYRDEYGQGAGGELEPYLRCGKRCPPKMHAAYSSSALVVNTFAPWKVRLGGLTLCAHQGFDSLKLEVRMPTGLGGTPPHLDFLAVSSGAAVAGESKVTEFLQEHRPAFAPVYARTSWPDEVRPYAEVMRLLEERPVTFEFLDAAQLIKHAFGLSIQRTSDAPGPVSRAVTLLYLFWEPENWQDHESFQRHREEIRRFSALIEGSAISFEARSHAALWRQWESSGDGRAREHARMLSERYSVRI